MSDEAAAPTSDYLRLSDPTRLRTVTFFDPAPDGTGLHVTGGLLLNGEAVPLRVPGNPGDNRRVGTPFEWQVIGGLGREMLCSLVVHPDDVVIAGGPNRDQFYLGHFPVFAPLDHPWERLAQPRGALAYPINATTGRISNFPEDSVGVTEWVRVWMQVDEVVVGYRQ